MWHTLLLVKFILLFKIKRKGVFLSAKRHLQRKHLIRKTQLSLYSGATVPVHFTTEFIHYAIVTVHFTTVFIECATVTIHFTTVFIECATVTVHFTTVFIQNATVTFHFSTFTVASPTPGSHLISHWGQSLLQPDSCSSFQYPAVPCSTLQCPQYPEVLYSAP